MPIEALVSLIVAVLGLIFKTVQDHNKEVANAPSTKLQELRKTLVEAAPAAVSGVLSDQHDRVSEVLRGSPR